MLLLGKQHLAFSFESIVNLLSKFRVVRKISPKISTVVAESVVNLVYGIRTAAIANKNVSQLANKKLSQF